MPIIKRQIGPVDLSRSSLAPSVRNELECVTNNTLANVIKQLSSLSQHAEDMFGELFNDASNIFERANSLQERVDRLKVKVTQLDSTVEEVTPEEKMISLQDINQRKPFRSSSHKEAQVISIASRPYSITQMYKECDAPPPLDKLNVFREDGRDSMKFYTDPTYFFELWCSEMQKDTEAQKKELKKRRAKRPKGSGGGREPHKIREVQSRAERYEQLKMGKEFVPDMPKTMEDGHSGDLSPNARPASLGPLEPSAVPGHYDPNYDAGGPPGYNESQQIQNYKQQQAMYNHNHADYAGPANSSPQHTPGGRRGPGNRTPAQLNSPARPGVAPPPPPPGAGVKFNDMVSDMGNRSDSASRESIASSIGLPPPPPPPTDGPIGRGTPPYNQPLSNHMAPLQQPSPPRTMKNSTREDPLPPPPPPPPPMQTDGGGFKAPMSNGLLGGINDVVLRSPIPEESSQAEAEVVDERSDLLAAIRQGLQLRKVEERRVKEEKRRHTGGPLDVQSIMEQAFEMRRKALEANDDESEEEADDSDVGVWDSDE